MDEQDDRDLALNPNDDGGTRDEDDLDAELWDIARDITGAVNLIGRLSLLGLMRERGASPGLRHFAQTFGIRLKDRNMSTAKLIRYVSRELDSAESHVHAAAAAALRSESGEPNFEAAFARFGLKTAAEMSLAVLAGLSVSVVSVDLDEALEGRQARLEGEFSPSEAAMAVTLLSLVERYLAESGLVESSVAVERSRNIERERDKLQEEAKRLRRLVQEQKVELTALRKQKAKPAVPTPAAPGLDRDEIRALRRENHELRKLIETLERELHPDLALREEPGSSVRSTPPAETEAAASSTPDLSIVKGKTILVVGGDSKHDVYREIVGELGGRSSFMAGFQARPIYKEDVAGYDAVIFVSTQLRHAVFDRVKGHAKALGVPFRIVTHKGNEAFITALVECLGGSET
jgi:hypothetical protein